jgi:hypothetical protein
VSYRIVIGDSANGDIRALVAPTHWGELFGHIDGRIVKVEQATFGHALASRDDLTHIGMWYCHYPDFAGRRPEPTSDQAEEWSQLAREDRPVFAVVGVDESPASVGWVATFEPPVTHTVEAARIGFEVGT